MTTATKSKPYLFWIMTGVLFLFPVVFLILKSFTFPFGYGDAFQLDFTVSGWRTLFSEQRLISATFTSLWIGAIVVVLNAAVGLVAGKALAFYSFKGKSLVDTLFLLPIIFPLLAIAMGVHIAMIRLGLADTWIGVILIHLVPTIPYSIKILRNGYVSLGTNILDQATMLGASSWRRFVTVEFPMLMPAIRSTVFLAFIISLSQYVITAIIGGGSVVTLAMVYFPFLQSANSTILAAFSMWFALLPILFYLLVELLICFLPYQKPWRITK